MSDSTLTAIRKKIRRLTASPSESALTTADIDEYINTFYTQDFVYGVKIDQMKTIYTFFTSPHVDRYPLDINSYQGIRGPVYFEGIRGSLFKDRGQFLNMWPRFPTLFQPISGDGVTTSFTFTVGATPILSTMFVIGGVDVNGDTIRVVDDGGIMQTNGNVSTTGNLLLLTSNNLGNFDPAIPNTYPIPASAPSPPPAGNNIGTINYVTGEVTVDFPVAPAAGSEITVWASQYSAGRPYCLLYWNNELHVRPVPDRVYKVELETYMTPAQFLNASSNPTLNQWWQYIAIGAAMKVLEDRQDMEGVQNLIPMFQRQESLVLERQGVEEIGQRNGTIFSDIIQTQNYGAPNNGWY